MKKKILCLMLSFSMIAPAPAKADLWGGDVVVLAKILVQAIQQLVQLKKIVSNAKDSLNLVREINAGINDSLNLLKTIHPDVDPGLFKDWRTASTAMRNIERLYGKVGDVKSKDLYRANDISLAETVVFNNKIFKESKKVDDIGDRIKSQSHNVSPGGAQKLTAQSMGVLLHVQNHSLRAQAKSLKLQAQILGRENMKDKEEAKMMADTVDDITKAMQTQKKNDKFKIPRF